MADLSITAGSVVPIASGSAYDTRSARGIAGATITAGQTLYIDTAASNTLKLADANASAATALVAGIALCGASSGQPVEYAVGGDLTFNAAFTQGLIYINSTTAGAIAPHTDLATGNYTTVLGVAVSTTRLRLAPNFLTAAVATT